MTKNTAIHLAVALGCVLLTVSTPALDGFQTTPATGSTPGGATDGALQSAKELQALVAPIALYPDALVAQILSAATFPDQVAVADNWLQSHKNLSGSKLVKEVDKESWSASVKALTSFPSVLDQMAKNLAWTSSLGEAYHNQADDVMKAVQTLRKQAKDSGHLKSSSQIKVTEPSSTVIEIQPANPQIVYVPVYNPAVIYGVPYVVPGYTAGEVAAATAISFGAGIAIGAMMAAPWGWSTWGCDWHGGVVVYNHSAFYGNAAWHGAYYHGGYHYGGYGYANTYNHVGAYGASYGHVGAYGASASYGHMGAYGGSAAYGHVSATSVSSSSWAHSSGGFNDDGWSSRAASSRGWSSMHAGGFSGGRFSGGGFGGGHFGGRR